MWSDTDRVLALALDAYEQDMHGPCGQPLLFSTDPDARGHYKASTVTCYACEALEAASPENPRPGLLVSVAPDAALTYGMENPYPEQARLAPLVSEVTDA